MIESSVLARIGFWSLPKDSYHTTFQKVSLPETKYLFFTCSPDDQIFEVTCKEESQQLTQAFASDAQ